MADPTSPNPTQLDPNIAELDPYIRRMKAAGTEEVLSGLARVGRGERAPERPDYTAERTRLIGMLGQLTELETASRSETAKTARAQFALQGTLLATIGKIEAANLGAQGTVLAARIGYFEQRDKVLSEQILREGPRTAADLPTAARTNIGALGGYIKSTDGTANVKPGSEAAFARVVTETINTLESDPRLVEIYRDEVQKAYGVDIAKWFAGKQGDASLGPQAASIIPILQQGKQAQAEAANVVLIAAEERAQNAKKILDTPGVSPGGALARAVNQYAEGVGLDLGTKDVSGLPPKPGEAPAAASGAAPAGGTVARTEARTEGLRPYLQEQRDLILKELDRLENAADPESVRLRQKVMASPALAQWAAENGYADYRPDQQFKAALAYRRKAIKEQDAAFNAQLESDILSGEAGTALGRAGVKIKRFLTGETARRDRTIEEGLAEARRRRAAKEGEAGPTPAPTPAPAPATDSAELVGGAAGPADKAPNVPESAPSITEQPKETIEAAMAEEQPLEFEEAAPFSEASPFADYPRGIGGSVGVGTARARNEVAVQTYLSQAEKDPKIVEAYEIAQRYKRSSPAAYAATLQGIADKIKMKKAAPTVFTPGETLERDWRAQARSKEGASAPQMPVMPSAPEAEPSMTVPEEAPEETPEAVPEEMPEETPKPEGETPDGVGAYEISPEDEAFLAQLGTTAESPQTTQAPASIPSPSTVEELAQPAGKPQPSSASRMAEAVKPPMFQSFGAEAATAAAGETRALYQQMLDEETRKRRAGMLRGSMMA